MDTFKLMQEVYEDALGDYFPPCDGCGREIMPLEDDPADGWECQCGKMMVVQKVQLEQPIEFIAMTLTLKSEDVGPNLNGDVFPRDLEA